jgi:pyruvate dehydrogenase E2 component (dihydrolipoamide acetyltransferase)
MIEFRMPSLGADMDTGTLVEWYKRPGDPLKRGDIIALVETQKGAIEIEVFNDGFLGEINVRPGQKVPVGTVMATVVEPGEARTVTTPPGPTRPTEEPVLRPVQSLVVEPAEAKATAAPPKKGMPGQAKVTPAARKRAAEAGFDLSAIQVGPDGIVGLRELDAALAARPSARRPGLDLGEMRKAIAAAMTRSHREIPHYWVAQAIDVTALFAWLEAENARRLVASRLLYAAPLIKAVALALKDTPELNGQYIDDAFRPASSVHLGIGMALRGGGLVAPALHDVEKLAVGEIMAALADLVPRARAGRLRSSELTDASATLSNLGEGTSDTLMPLIYPPQVAIVGCGAATMRPWVADDKVAARRILNVTIAGDHRVSDGRRASQFLSRLDQLMQEPGAL